MFDKLAPVPIKNPTHRKLLVFSMTWFLVGTWIDASAHSYLNGELESFFYSMACSVVFWICIFCAFNNVY